jgi:hypothetical protein
MMASMFKSLNKKLLARSNLPLCANVYDFSGGGTGSGATVFNDLKPSFEVGLSGSGNTIGFLQRNQIPSQIKDSARLTFGVASNTFNDYDWQDVVLSVTYGESTPVDIVTHASIGSGMYHAGASGFYFRNETTSEYFYSLTQYRQGNSNDGLRLTVLGIPAGRMVNAFVNKDFLGAGVHADFELNSWQNGPPLLQRMDRGLPQTLNNNDHLTVSFKSIASDLFHGSFFPLTGSERFVVGQAKSDGLTSTYKFDNRKHITSIRYITLS